MFTVALHSYLLERMDLLGLVLGEIMRSFFGERTEFFTHHIDRRQPDQLSPEQLALAYDGWGLSTSFMKFVKRHNAQALKDGVHEYCAHCGREGRMDAQAAERFKVCKRCHEVGRMVRYCSRYVVAVFCISLLIGCVRVGSDCQLNDWKRGNPAHKATCGKRLSELTDALPASPSHPPAGAAKAQGIPPARDGFVRSAALQYQIQLLIDKPEVDYFLVGWHSTAERSHLSFPAARKAHFREIRNRAFYDAHGPCVWVLWRALGNAVGEEVGMGNLRRQVEAEYGVDVEEMEGGDELEMLAAVVRAVSAEECTWLEG